MKISKPEQESDIKNMVVSEPWASFIINRVKTVEVRKNNPNNWGSLKVGDKLLIISKDSEDKKRLFLIKEIRIYDSLSSCFVAEGVRNLLPGKKTINDAMDIYLGFDGSSETNINDRKKEFQKYGCIAIELIPAEDLIMDASEFYPSKFKKEKEELKIHVNGSLNPEGDLNCDHKFKSGDSAIEYNQETMGGCGSGWDERCSICGKVWY